MEGTEEGTVVVEAEVEVPTGTVAVKRNVHMVVEVLVEDMMTEITMMTGTGGPGAGALDIEEEEAGVHLLEGGTGVLVLGKVVQREGPRSSNGIERKNSQILAARVTTGILIITMMVTLLMDMMNRMKGSTMISSSNSSCRCLHHRQCHHKTESGTIDLIGWVRCQQRTEFAGYKMLPLKNLSYTTISVRNAV